MRVEEAIWIGKRLAESVPGALSPVLELGSGTVQTRQILRPHIDEEIYAPLRQRGVTVVHSDIAQGDGVDISGDIYDEEVRRQLANVRANCLVCCNILEHVRDRAGFAEICDALLSPGGLLVVTVPRDYPYHPDPIDTYYRPQPEDVAALFAGYTVTAHTVIQSTSYGQDLGGAREIASVVVKSLLKSLLLRGGWRASWSRVHRLAWLAKPYKITAVELRKPT